ncbi:MAG: TspO/MBR family protein [Oscillospiraceae bacterium]
MAVSITWTILYLLMGIAMGRVWRAGSGSARRQAAALWCVQLGVNGFWPVVFFLWQEHGAAFFLLAGLIALVLAMSAQFSRRDPAAAWLCAPYLLWLLFAAYLNLGVWLLNR